MKKILSLLASAALVASASATVVACNNPTTQPETIEPGEGTKATLALNDSENKTILKNYSNKVNVTLSTELKEDETLTLESKLDFVTIGQAVKDTTDSKKYSFDISYNENVNIASFISLNDLITGLISGNQSKKELLTLKIGKQTLSSIDLEIGLYNINLTSVQELVSSDLIKGIIAEYIGDEKESVLDILDNLFTLPIDESLNDDSSKYFNYYGTERLAEIIELIGMALFIKDWEIPENILNSIIPLINTIFGISYGQNEETIFNLEESIFNVTIENSILKISVKTIDKTLIDELMTNFKQKYEEFFEEQPEEIDTSLFENFNFTGNLSIELTSKK